MKTVCIMMSGAPRSGKDEVAKYLNEKYGFKQESLAKPIYGCIRAIFNLDEINSSTQEYKSTVIPKWGMSPREMLQKLGHDLKEFFGKDIWCRSLADRMQKGNIVLSDVRYPEEVDFFKDNGFKVIVIRLFREGCVGAKEGIQNHESEKMAFPADYKVDNNGTIEDLHEIIDQILMQENLIFDEKE